MELFNLFSQFGLNGLVIAALFASLWALIKKIDGIVQVHDKQIEGVVKDHKEEREKWLQAYQANTEVLRALSSKCPK